MTNPVDELTNAAAGRVDWRLDGPAERPVAVYEPPGATGTVRIRVTAAPTSPRELFTAILYRLDGTPERTLAVRGAREAVAWAERLLPRR